MQPLETAMLKRKKKVTNSNTGNEKRRQELPFHGVLDRERPQMKGSRGQGGHRVGVGGV